MLFLKWLCLHRTATQASWLPFWQVVLLGPHATSKEALLGSYYNSNAAGGVPSFAEAFQASNSCIVLYSLLGAAAFLSLHIETC